MVQSNVFFTVEITSEVNCFEVPDQQGEAPGIRKNRVSSPSGIRKVVDAHRIGGGGGSTGGTYPSCLPTPLGERVYQGRQQGALPTSWPLRSMPTPCRLTGKVFDDLVVSFRRVKRPDRREQSGLSFP